MLLALVGLGFDNAALTLAIAALLALAIRAVARPPPRSRRKVRIGERERIGWAVLGLVLLGGHAALAGRARGRLGRLLALGPQSRRRSP